jgi:quercetin dioxygenase-like cupin family protein
MRVHSGRVAGSPSLREGENFTGEVWVDLMLDDVEDVMSYNVFFTPGARTNWHRHTGGQILYVTSGSGRVVSRRGEAVRVRTGDVIWTEPDEEHWHGADPDSYMSHTAVSLGEAVWLEPVDEEQYAAAEAAAAGGR